MNTHGTPWVNDPGDAIRKRVEEVFEPEDERHGRVLTLVIRLFGACRLCGRALTDQGLKSHPAVCSRCWDHRRQEARVVQLQVVEEMRVVVQSDAG